MPRNARWQVLAVVVCVLCAERTPVVAASEASASSLDPGLRSEIRARTSELPRLHSLLISIDGQLVEEQYYRGANERRLANLKSASKSIVSILVGIAIDLGYLAGLDQPIAEFFPRFFTGTVDPVKTTITLEDLLTM